MHPVAKRYLSRTALGLVALGAGVPLLQSQPFMLSTAEQPVIRVSGDIAGLTPGKPGRLVLTVHNDSGTVAEVHHLSAVPAAQVPGCDIAVRPWAGEMAVPARGTGKRALQVTVTGAKCSGATWQLNYSATG